MNFFDMDTLEKSLNEASFEIEELFYVADKNINEKFLLDGRESIEAIGRRG
jgi:hypothetical protein